MPSCVSAFFTTFMAKYVAFRKFIPRFLKSVIHIPEEGHLGLASLLFIGISKKLDSQ